MDAKSYCEGLKNGLIGWKAKLYDTIRKADLLTDNRRAEVQQMVENLNSVIDDLDARIDRLSSECPVEFTSDRFEIEGQVTRLKEGWKEVYGVFGEDEYGKGGA